LEKWPKILVPACFGQSLGFCVAHEASLAGLLLPWAFTLTLLVYIMLLNDWGDARVDSIKRRLFPQAAGFNSIGEGILSSRNLWWTGMGALAASIFFATVLATLYARSWFLAGALFAVVLFQAYSFSPLKLNYRGGGEILEMLGIGVLLPWLHAYGQSGLLWHPLYQLLFGLLPLSFAMALGAGLVDEESDLVGGKRTFTTMWGNRRVRNGIARFFVLGLLLWAASLFYLRSLVPAWMVLLPLACLGYYFMHLATLSTQAITRAHSAQQRYRSYLQRGVLTSTALLALCILLAGNRSL
jgi:1,4-dihydroxy-2-naphthoate octaprenyltransferase/chlorophyll synthase